MKLMLTTLIGLTFIQTLPLKAECPDITSAELANIHQGSTMLLKGKRSNITFDSVSAVRQLRQASTGEQGSCTYTATVTFTLPQQ